MSSIEHGYLPRVADKVLARKLKSSGAVQIKGPKWCGKTATAEQAAASSIYMQDPDNGPSYIQLADSKPSLLLKGDEPRLIDEWQMAPQLWDAVRFAIDRGKGRGRFILTGSATPRASEMPAHSGVGRIARINMRPMSLFESRESTGSVSLASLFDGNTDVADMVDFDIERIVYSLCRGGWPEAVIEPNHGIALSMAPDYISELLDSDIDEIDGLRRNKTWMAQIIRSYARNISTEASLATIAADMQGEPPSRNTVSEYVDALTRACVFEDLEAWAPRLRSKLLYERAQRAISATHRLRSQPLEQPLKSSWKILRHLGFCLNPCALETYAPIWTCLAARFITIGTRPTLKPMPYSFWMTEGMPWSRSNSVQNPSILPPQTSRNSHLKSMRLTKAKRPSCSFSLEPQLPTDGKTVS